MSFKTHAALSIVHMATALLSKFKYSLNSASNNYHFAYFLHVSCKSIFFLFAKFSYTSNILAGVVPGQQLVCHDYVVCTSHGHWCCSAVQTIQQPAVEQRLCCATEPGHVCLDWAGGKHDIWAEGCLQGRNWCCLQWSNGSYDVYTRLCGGDRVWYRAVWYSNF